jgi:asparagine synthase (glutamine-hydrolysing)
MCGIIAYMGKDLTIEEFKEKSKLIKHRGPDNYQDQSIDNVLFGFHRLRINDTSKQGDQPFNTESLMLMCNGEIYNSEHLVEKYQFDMKSSSDCEVIIHLYEKFQDMEKVINELNGVFSFALYDKITQTLFIARDPFGVRSLYIGKNNDLKSIMISSELRSLNSMDHVSQFPPNHYAVICGTDHINVNIRPYNQVLSQPKIHSDSDSTPKMIYDLLDSAVKSRLLSDRPIGCLLSGGLDSSVIAYLLSRRINNLNTYSIGLSKDSPDLKYARIVANSIGSNHHEIILPESDFIEAIPKVIEVIESYDTTSVRASVPMYLLCKYIKENTTDVVIFSGEGSDELFGGYLYFHNAPSEIDFHNETTRLLTDIHLYDGLRSDKSISGNSLEARIPFLDTAFVNYVYNIETKLKMGVGGIEKYILRKAFDGLLPNSVIWRTKTAFSDGCSNSERSWYKIIQEHVETVDVQNTIYAWNPPKLRESMWYRQIFSELFPNRDTVMDYYWLPKWCGDINDPSARELSSILNINVNKM